MTQSENPKPQYAVNDEITIMRGLDRGKVAKVIGVDLAKEQYAVTFTDGSFSVVNFVNTKPPVEGSITATALAAIVSRHNEVDDLAAELAKTVDGFAKAYDAAE